MKSRSRYVKNGRKMETKALKINVYNNHILYIFNIYKHFVINTDNFSQKIYVFCKQAY